MEIRPAAEEKAEDVEICHGIFPRARCFLFVLQPSFILLHMSEPILKLSLRSGAELLAGL